MNVLKDYLESDYAPIPYTENIWLPKCFNDRKFLTAYVRKSTRLGIRLTDDVCLPVWESVKNARKAGFSKDQLHEVAEWSRQSNNLAKYASLFQQKLIEVEYQGIMPSRSQSQSYELIDCVEATQAPYNFR